MMVDVNRRISQWDQKRILSSVDSGGRTEIVSGQRPSKVVREVSVAEEEGPRPSAAISGTSAAEPGRTPAATTDGAALAVPDQGQ